MTCIFAVHLRPMAEAAASTWTRAIDDLGDPAGSPQGGRRSSVPEKYLNPTLILATSPVSMPSGLKTVKPEPPEVLTRRATRYPAVDSRYTSASRSSIGSPSGVSSWKSMLTSPLAETLIDGPPTNRTTGKVSSRTKASVMAGQVQPKPRAIGTVQIWVLNALGKEVLSKSPSQQFEHPSKG